MRKFILSNTSSMELLDKEVVKFFIIFAMQRRFAVIRRCKRLRNKRSHGITSSTKERFSDVEERPSLQREPDV